MLPVHKRTAHHTTEAHIRPQPLLSWPGPTCRWETVHYRGNFPAPMAELGVAVDSRGTVYIAGGCCCSGAIRLQHRAAAYPSQLCSWIARPVPRHVQAASALQWSQA